MKTPIQLRWIPVAAIALAALVGCGRSLAPQDDAASNKDATALDLTGTDQPADLGSADNAAKATVSVVKIVSATALVFGELADAVGDLVPSNDNPCPNGGSADGNISGSFNHPRVRMSFSQCVRADNNVLNGVATVTCNDLHSDGCVAGNVVVGDGDAVLHFTGASGVILMRGSADISLDKAAQTLHANTSLQGELRSLDEARHYAYITDTLMVDIHKLDDGSAEVKLDGVAGNGGDADAANCISGRFDTQTPADPLVVDNEIIRSGMLNLFSPPPRPGTQQANATYVDGGATVQGATGTPKTYTPEALAEFCSLS